MAERWGDECGVFGVYAQGRALRAAQMAYVGLYALQHRGEEAAGIVSCDGHRMHLHKGLGLASRVFDEEILASLVGQHAIGHVRYSTSGANTIANAQPLMVHCRHGLLALAHNGNLTNTGAIRKELEQEGAVFASSTDSEVMVHLLARSRAKNLVDAVQESLSRLEGAYVFLILTPQGLLAVRDPQGFRPLCRGSVPGAVLFASETCALENLRAQSLTEVEPGQAVWAHPGGVDTLPLLPPARKSLCVFEYVYLARPDSVLEGRSVHMVRRAIGRQLAAEDRADAELVIAAPDSAIPAAMGYAEAAGLPFENGLVKNRYIGRTFIQPEDSIREAGVAIKLNPIRAILEGRRVVLVDDSIVRGTTSQRTVAMLRAAGAAQVHLRIASPPYLHPCFFGVDTPTSEELIATHGTVAEIRAMLGADTLRYLSLEGLLAAVGLSGEELCTACFTGQYPVPVSSAARGEDW